jgi:hypothetical protein
MNKVTIEPILRKVVVQKLLNKVVVQAIRIQTDYQFQWFNQVTPTYKEV